jgi:molecular chaperone GrpE
MPANGSRHEDEALGRADKGAEASKSKGKPVDPDPEQPKSAPRIRDLRVGREDDGEEVRIVSNPFGAGFDDSEEVEQLTKERDELVDALRRTQADFENYKKRVDRQSAEVRDRANERIVSQLLPALDAFALARAHMSEDETSAETKALLQAAALFESGLEKEGLERIDAKEVAFDPTSHEAVERKEASEDDPEEGQVVDEIYRPGYVWKGRVLRPAMVRVRG